MSIDAAVSAWCIIKDGRSEATEVGAGYNEEQDDGDQTGEIKNRGLQRMCTLVVGMCIERKE